MFFKTKIRCAHFQNENYMCNFGISQNCWILGKSRKNLVKFSKHSAKFWQILQHFVKNRKKIQQFLTKKLRLENGADVFLARPFSFQVFPGFWGFDSKTVQRSAIANLPFSSCLSIFFFSSIPSHRGIRLECIL